MLPRSIFLYPAGGWKSDAAWAPSLMLESSKVLPSEAMVLTGYSSFWSIHAVVVAPFLLVMTHLSQLLPFTVSVPTFWHFISAPHGWAGSNALGVAACCCRIMAGI